MLSDIRSQRSVKCKLKAYTKDKWKFRCGPCALCLNNIGVLLAKFCGAVFGRILSEAYRRCTELCWYAEDVEICCVS
jgi:hypothetical protein